MRGTWLLVRQTGRFLHCWTYFRLRSNEDTLIQNNCWINAMVFKMKGGGSHFLKLNLIQSNTICCVVLNLYYNPDDLSKGKHNRCIQTWCKVRNHLIKQIKANLKVSPSTPVYIMSALFFIGTPSVWWCIESVQEYDHSLPSDSFDLGFNFYCLTII